MSSERSPTMSPRERRTRALENEINELKPFIQNHPMYARSLPTYFTTPFQTDEARARESSREVNALLRNSGLHRDQRCDRASTYRHDLGEVSEPARAPHGSGKHALGGVCHSDRAEPSTGSDWPEHGGVRGQDRASIGVNSAWHDLGGVCGQDRAGSGWQSASHDLGGEYEQDRAQRGRSPPRCAVMEDADLKAAPITLPSLPSLESKDASLEAGDWLIQLEPLIGDISKNALTWWRQIMVAVKVKYNKWLHADPLTRLHITAPEGDELPDGYGRLDQRVTSLLLQSVPKSIKDEVVASRELSTHGILFKVFRAYQPEGLSERSKLLEDLTTVPAINGFNDVVASLQKRKASRATELCAQLPDPLLMIRTLDGIAKPIVDGLPQAAFRIATFRMNKALDVRPSLDNVWLFYDLLLAEAESAAHSPQVTSSPTTDGKPQGKPTVKTLQPSPGEKTPDQQRQQWPCKFWMSESGCRQGQRCRWPHPWDSAGDKSRCKLCGSTQHQQQDCPTKAQAKQPVGGEGEAKQEDGKKGKGGGKGKQKSKDAKGKGSPAEDKKETTTSTTETSKTSKPAGNDGVDKNNDKTGEANKSSGSGGTSELLHEATKLLKSLQLGSTPTIKAVRVEEIGNGSQPRNGQALVDSGATHVLRQAKSWDEWQSATPTTVALAQGSTDKFRLLPIAAPDDDIGASIIPMGALPRIGYDIQWSRSSCMLRGPQNKLFDVEVINGCPMLCQERGSQLIEQLERHGQAAYARMAMAKAILKNPEILGEVATEDPSLLLAVMLKKEFPQLPEDIVNLVVPHSKQTDGEALPWNRRQRRAISRSRRIALHLFSGPDVKTWKQLERNGTMVLCIDKILNPKMDLLDDNLMIFLLQLAASGKLAAILGGPPCRTISADRNRDGTIWAVWTFCKAAEHGQ